MSWPFAFSHLKSPLLGSTLSMKRLTASNVDGGFQRAGFDAVPALRALARHACTEHPQSFAWNGRHAEALHLGTAVDEQGRIEQTAPGRFGNGDEVARCLQGLPASWRLAGLLCLAFTEDFAIWIIFYGPVK